MAAQRFPGKPLTKIAGMTMIEHVYRRCAISVGAEAVWIATCDRSIEDAAKTFGAKVIMTADTHVRCTDRVAEAARKLDSDIVINVQGDEPVLDPESLNQVLRPFRENSGCLASNLIQKINPASEDPKNYNIVKVVFNKNKQALYFSREPIPSPQRTDVKREYFKQIGLIAFRRDFLETFSKLAPTPLEAAESVDMLRMLEHGYTLDLVETQSRFLSVDIPGDVPPVEEALKHDPNFAKYRVN
jgi:3-deoxy-manno-octulosonate cytidylyltransferase (CMP-KDO synthetase)